MPILSCANTLVNNCGVNKRTLGRNVISGSFTTIEHLRHSCRIVSGKWSHFSQPSPAAVMPVYFEKRCMKFIFREFSGAMPALRPRFLEQQGHCSLF